MEPRPTDHQCADPIDLIFREAGFPVVGKVDFDLAQNEYQKHVDHYQRWIQKKAHGEMAYLDRGLGDPALDRRANPRLVFPDLQGVVTVLSPYSSNPVGNESIHYARYLRGRDYHDDVSEKLKRAVENWKKIEPTLVAKVCVDTSAVLERAWASLCGLGWIGKNTLLIHPQWGSYVFIGVVFTNQKWNQAPKMHPDYCGECTRCLKRCPTEAFPEPRFLDARRCISYLTLEKRGPFADPVDLSGYVAGCDLCQEVCPFNTKVAKKPIPSGPESHLVVDLDLLKQETEAEYRARVKGTSLSRIKFADFRRNLQQFD